MTHTVSVSIINYRTGDLTLQCVQSVLDDLGDVDGHVVVVDNASGDGSDQQIADWIAAQPSGTPVQLVRSQTNSGFSGGHNQGIAAARAEFYLVLNSDAILRQGFFKAILATALAKPQAGLYAPRLETEDGVVQISSFRFPGAGSEFIRSACTGFITHLFRRYEVAIGPDPQDHELDWASFACILLRDEMVQQIGPMDEGYFLYFEDAEYCLRARRLDWRIARAPAAIAVHFRGGSGPVKALAKAYKRMPPYYYASRARFMRQAHGPLGPFLANIAWHVGRGVAQMRRLLRKRVNRVSELEYRDIWTNIGGPLCPKWRKEWRK